MDLDPKSSVVDDQLWSITNSLKSNNINNVNATNANTIKTRQKSQDVKDSNSQQQTSTPQIVHDSTLSIYERLRHFLYINFVLNKKSFILSILSYLADLVLFIALNLYLFSNKKFINEMICLPIDYAGGYYPTNNFLNTPNTTAFYSNESKNSSILEIRNLTKRELILNKITSDSLSNTLNSSQFKQHNLEFAKQPAKSLKQSYLTLQIIIIFVFFICFILSYLIKLQFKYHRLALNLYDYDIELGGGPLFNSGKNSINQQHDRESLASTTTASHFSSSANNNSKRIIYLLKRLLNRLLTKLASILLNFFIGYQFCQNCFIQQPDEIKSDAYSIFIHIFILTCVLFRCSIQLLSKKNSMNQLNHLKKLQQKQKDLFDPKNSKNYPHRFYYYYYYSYLIRSNQNSCNQLKQHQANQNTFRIFQLNDVSLFIGFLCALFHLFNFLKAFELIFVFLPMLLILILFRFKSLLNGALNLFVLFISILIISSSSSFNSIQDISSFYLNHDDHLKNTSSAESLNVTSTNMTNCNIDLHNKQNSSSIINLFSYNLLTFFCFLLTFYLKSLLSIYYCTLTTLERWNLSFLCKRSVWRKLFIYFSFLIYIIFSIACTISLCIKLTSWLYLILPFFFLLTFVWCSFQLLNTINLTHLMNKISDCFLLLNESNSLSNANSFENSSNISKKSRTTSHIYNPNRNSALSQSSNFNSNNNGQTSGSGGGNTTGNTSSFRFTKFLSRFLSYNKLNMIQQHDDDSSHISTSASVTTNVPIHRILAYKGVRHLGSISYRISLYCFVQTILIAPFAFYTSSPITIGLYLITLSLNFIWLSLLYQFPKTASGTCIAYAVVAPPLILNIYNAGTIGTQSSSASSNPTLISSKTKYRTGSSTSTSNTTTTYTTTTTTGSSALFLPFNYQQALTQRCTFILNKMHNFLQFHLIENFGCDFASTGLQKQLLESKLKSFFQKKSNDGSYYNTYLLYYCGPTSVLTDGLTFVDGDELTIEQIVENWKQVHCYSNEDDSENDLENQRKINPDSNNSGNDSDGSNSNNIQNQPNQLQPSSSTHLNTNKKTKKSQKINNSRLIIVLDAENTSKSLQYVKTKLRESNVYVALQTAKYNFNSNQFKNNKTTSNKGGIENKLILGGKSAKNGKQSLMGPGSPQTITGSFFDSYLNIGKFTLDWIKSNCNAAYNFYDNSAINEIESLNHTQNFLGGFNHNINNDYLNEEKEDEDEEDEYRDDDDDDDDEDEDDDDDNDNNSNEYDVEKQTMNKKKGMNGNNTSGTKSPQSGSFFYETKCAFSRYWIDFKFDNSNDKTLAHDFNQFWHLYYPSFICKPLLKLINCRLFYLKFDFLKKIIFLLRRIKNQVIPIHEYDTGHGFKLFSS